MQFLHLVWILLTPQQDRAQQVVMIWSLSIIFYSVGWVETAAVYLQTKLSNNLYALCQRHGSVSIHDLVIANISPVLFTFDPNEWDFIKL